MFYFIGNSIDKKFQIERLFFSFKTNSKLFLQKVKRFHEFCKQYLYKNLEKNSGFAKKIHKKSDSN